ncbi:hypothetical protein [Motilimonas pumila]|uniref:Uncharacterized protein n=1 Tax=Motilimonas pumila TaxID=2303987 RepID=A0A418YDM6_9GAMM|nr:hypothetical protein [Motilimonas pumila]RJG42635.1 hypothetical protein D1Z90_12260 [Motilimonas pumila]
MKLTCMAKAAVLSATLALSACTSIGPQTVAQDRFDYNTAIADSWKEQTLLNIVKLRYADMPLFVEVASIVNGYSLESSVNLSGTLASDIPGDFASAGASGKFTDRPTITYTPITGQQFNKNFMTPIPPQAILFMMQSGWSADLVLPLTVDSINGLRAEKSAGNGARLGDDAYYRAIDLLTDIQRSGAVGMRIVEGQGAKRDTTVMFYHSDLIKPEVEQQTKELNALLRINPDVRELTIRYGLIASNEGELAMLTRSMLQLMITLAGKVNVPEVHVDEGRTVANIASKANHSDRLINIRHSKEKPADAFSAIKYKDYWFWIDDTDFQSKRTFAFLMILFSLTETGGRDGLPLVTISS